MRENIPKFEEIGMHPASQRNAITEALNFHDSMGEVMERIVKHGSIPA